MSDITKKIFSIEQAEDTPIQSEPSTSDIIRPLADEKTGGGRNKSPEKVPEFVTREAVRPLSTPPSILDEAPPSSKAAGWVIICLGMVYVIGAGLYFGLPLIGEPASLFTVAGLVLLLSLPLILLFLLWRALRHLSAVSQQNAQLSKAAEILVSPDREVLQRSETLASGIQEQISKVNSSLSDTVEALKGVQIAVTRESQALDAAGLVLSNRSDDVGRNLTLQRQALESMSGTFDTRMTTLSSQIVESGQVLEGICTAAETKIMSAGDALGKVSGVLDETATSSAERIAEKVATLEETNLKLTETAETFTAKIGNSTETLLETDKYFAEYSDKFQELNAETQSQLSDLQATIGHGYQMLDNLKSSSELRRADIASYYEGLSNQLKQSEDDTLAAQGQTARMVETNLAQMRRDFSRMETNLQSLQIKLNRLREASDTKEEVEVKPARLNLTPLDSDFPPVEPPRFTQKSKPKVQPETPLNLGMDMEIETPEDPLLNFEPDVIRRPGETEVKSKGRGFGRRNEKDEKSAWRWRDMLGTLERPDNGGTVSQPPGTFEAQSTSARKIDGVALLTALQLSPAAIVDEGTVVDATQARINRGEPGLTATVAEKLPEAVAHLKANLEKDAELKTDLRAFTANFSKTIGNTPPTAPALRAAFGSPDGRAYLLCAAAFKPELRA